MVACVESPDRRDKGKEMPKQKILWHGGRNKNWFEAARTVIHGSGN
jgi:hypothetical protein